MNSLQRTARREQEKTRKHVLACLFTIAAMLLLGTSTATPAHAANAATGTGVGIILGEPSGFSLKLPQGRNSINIVIGYDLNTRGPGGCCGDGSRLYVGGDYVWYNYSLITVQRGRLPLYYGPGVFVSLHNDPVVGGRGVVGLEYQFAVAPFDLFIELGPRINVIPDTRTDLFGAFGGRFFFR
jgi:hypothetical protein